MGAAGADRSIDLGTTGGQRGLDRRRPFLVRGNARQPSRKAIRYTQDGGKVTGASPGSSDVALTVEDNGHGDSEADGIACSSASIACRLRGGRLRLGLAIVREIAMSHRAEGPR